MERLFTAEFFEMDGWASYIWPTYAIALVVIGGLAWRILRRNAETRRRLELAEARRRRLASAQTKQAESQE